MSYVITDKCLGERYATCVAVCPVDCIHPGEYQGEEFMIIDPEVCIDCSLCLPECPIGAIVETRSREPGVGADQRRADAALQGRAQGRGAAAQRSAPQAGEHDRQSLERLSTQPVEITLEVEPRARFDVIDVNRRILDQHGDVLRAYPRALYFSYHTTAGYLEQRLAARLSQRSDGVEPFIQVFKTLFPPDAGYRHDRLEEREELSEEQRQREPRNADSHLAFIGSGLKSCVTYHHRPGAPVYFIDLDGVNFGRSRRRQTSVVAYTQERVVERVRLEIPVSGHPVDSVNLRDPRIGLFPDIERRIARHGVGKGRVDIALAPGERQAGLTVNEFETLLMQHDLAEVLHEPMRFLVEKTRHALADPRGIPNRTIEYAKYDLVRVLNQLFETLGMEESLVERLVARMMAYPASRFLRMKRALSLLITAPGGDGGSTIVQGTYQSPILVQWRKSERQARAVDVTITELA